MKALFVTGRLAEPALRRVLDEIRLADSSFAPSVAVLPISVAALMTPKWAARHLGLAEGVERVILPGQCRGDLSEVESKVGVPVVLGPDDLRDLPRFLGRSAAVAPDDGGYDIEILAEINHAPRLDRRVLIAQAERFRREGADVIDLGCSPGARWREVGSAVVALKERGFRVSVDSFDPDEVADAVAAGAELVLSVNASNRDAAVGWGVEVVAVPDEPHSLAGLDVTTEFLEAHGIPHRLDPVLDPIGFGFADSLGRYLEVRRRYPARAVLMGVGNLTELTDVDSAGLNTLLTGFCQEARVGSVLTTAVINWARTSVREIDLARRLMRRATRAGVLPKHLEPALVLLRDPKLVRYGRQTLAEMAALVKDKNWRIFAEDGTLYAFNAEMFITGTDPFELFDQMGVDDPAHAFYLGHELMKAKTATTLGKNYRQDQALDWGYLTEPEVSHLERKKRQKGGQTP